MLKVSSTEKNRKQEFLASSNWLQYFQTNICNQKVMFCGFLQFYWAIFGYLVVINNNTGQKLLQVSLSQRKTTFLPKNCDSEVF